MFSGENCSGSGYYGNSRQRQAAGGRARGEARVYQNPNICSDKKEEEHKWNPLSESYQQWRSRSDVHWSLLGAFLFYSGHLSTRVIFHTWLPLRTSTARLLLAPPPIFRRSISSEKAAEVLPKGESRVLFQLSLCFYSQDASISWNHLLFFHSTFISLSFSCAGILIFFMFRNRTFEMRRKRNGRKLNCKTKWRDRA